MVIPKANKHAALALTSNRFSTIHKIFAVTLENRSTNTEGQMNVEGDVVLIYYQEKPAVYARIEAIGPDIKKDWYQVTLLILTIPAQTVTWILREEYINGTPFTMGGQPVRLEGVKGETKKPGKVIPFKKEKRSANPVSLCEVNKNFNAVIGFTIVSCCTLFEKIIVPHEL